MSHEPASTREVDSAAVRTDTAPQRNVRPWVSYLAIFTCIAIFVGLAARNDYQSWDTLTKFGHLPATSIWDGLLGARHVRVRAFRAWHLAFNMYWLWVLGSRLERAVGSLQYLTFLIVSAFVSSSFQLAASDTTGIGASGMGYAIFGFMWATRHRYLEFNQVLNLRTIQIFLIWLLWCVAATYLKVWEVGNAAHISGLLFGVAVAGTFVLHVKRRLMSAGLGALVVFSIVPLFWCPWSVTWLSHQAYKAHAAGRYDAAVDRYTQVIRIAPDNAWAYLNRSFAYRAWASQKRPKPICSSARKFYRPLRNANSTVAITPSPFKVPYQVVEKGPSLWDHWLGGGFLLPSSGTRCFMGRALISSLTGAGVGSWLVTRA